MRTPKVKENSTRPLWRLLSYTTFTAGHAAKQNFFGPLRGWDGQSEKASKSASEWCLGKCTTGILFGKI